MTPEQQTAFEATMASTGSKATYGGAGATVLGGVMSSELGVFVGIVVGLVGLIINWYYKHKQDRREEIEHERRMRAISQFGDIDDGEVRKSARAKRMRGRSLRLPIAVLGLSAAALVAKLQYEGYTEQAVVPVKGDRPTVGFGSTFRDDGTPVKMGDTITPPKAVARAYAHIQKDETALKRCVTAPLNQVEYDLLVDHAYQYGADTTCASAMVRHINAERYADACAAYLLYRKVAGRDCAVRSNGCYGVWVRSQDRNRKCMEAL